MNAPFLDIDLPLGDRRDGKVRVSYAYGDDRRLFVTTDRLSAFDRVIAGVPYKGQVLNQLSAWWFERTADVVANHVIDLPDPNVLVARAAEPLPVEVVVRGYITGVTSTSLWRQYADGARTDLRLPLPRRPAEEHRSANGDHHADHEGRARWPRRAAESRVTSPARDSSQPRLWREVEAAALELFARGQELATAVGSDPCRHEVRVRHDACRRTAVDRRDAHSGFLALLGSRHLRSPVAAATRNQRASTRRSSAGR